MVPAVNQAMRSQLDCLQQQNSSIRIVKILMQLLHDKEEIQSYLYFQEKKPAIEEMFDITMKIDAFLKSRDEGASLRIFKTLKED